MTESLRAQCATLNHQFEVFAPVPPRRRHGAGYYLSMRCSTCYTERHDHYDLLGGLISRQYIYTQAYLDERVDLSDSDRTYKQHFRTVFARQNNVTKVRK